MSDHLIIVIESRYSELLGIELDRFFLYAVHTASPPFSSESYRLRSGSIIFIDGSIGEVFTVLPITQACSMSYESA